jgi:integrase
MSTLTDAVIRKAPPREKEYEIKDTERPGLRLRVQPSGKKAFIYRFTFQGEYASLTLGTYGTMTLAQAIADRRKAADALVAGRDPREDRKLKHDDDATVTAHVARYEKAKAPDWSPTTASLAHAELEFLIDEVGAKPIKSVTRKDVQKVIDEALDRGPAAQVATWKWVRAFLQWCADRDDIPDSPAEKIKRPRDDTQRDRVLTDTELRKVWLAADAAGRVPGGSSAGALVKLLILTGCRRTEITHLKWSEIQDHEIVLPGKAFDRKTKNRKTHNIPITPAIRAVLDSLPQTGKYVVTGADAGLGGHTKAKAKVAAKVAPAIEHWTFHDLRRTMATGLAKLGVPLPVTERCLNHASGTHAKPLVKIYQQHDYAAEMVLAFEKWSEHVAALVGGEKMKVAA